MDIEGNSWEKLTESLESMQKALDQFQGYDPDPYNPFIRGKNEIRTVIRGGVAIFAAETTGTLNEGRDQILMTPLKIHYITGGYGLIIGLQ